MGLLNYLGKNLHDALFSNADKSSDNFSNIKGFDFYKLRKKRNIQNNLLDPSSKQVTISPIDDINLALNNPVQFINKYLNTETVEKAMFLNPNIEKILKENGLKKSYNIENAKKITMSHLIPTAKKAQNSYLALGHTKDEPNYAYLTQAALLHDIGKIFIPTEILDKKGRLTEKEKNIVNLHSSLGFEVLRTTRLHPKVASLTLEHHNTEGKVIPNDENQVLTMADIYCALKENRPYKKALSNIETLATMYDMATKGKAFNVKYMTCLKA